MNLFLLFLGQFCSNQTFAVIVVFVISLLTTIKFLYVSHLGLHIVAIAGVHGITFCGTYTHADWVGAENTYACAFTELGEILPRSRSFDIFYLKATNASLNIMTTYNFWQLFVFVALRVTFVRRFTFSS